MDCLDISSKGVFLSCVTSFPFFLIFLITLSYETVSELTSTVCFSGETSYVMPFVSRKLAERDQDAGVYNIE